MLGLLSMYIDKKRAEKGEYRIKEFTLWQIALLGGSLGSYIGMRKFRHKTNHSSFKIGFFLLATIQTGITASLIIWIITKERLS